MIIYEFLMTEKPMLHLKYKLLVHDGTCHAIKRAQALPANKEVNFIIAGAGGNGSRSMGIGIAGKGGAGGGAGEVVMLLNMTSENNVYIFDWF